MSFPPESPDFFRPQGFVDQPAPLASSPPPGRRNRWRAFGIGAIVVIAAVMVTGFGWPGWFGTSSSGSQPAASRPNGAAPPVSGTPTPSASAASPPRSPSPSPRTQQSPQAVAETYVLAINRADLDLELTTLCVRPPRTAIDKARAQLVAQRPVARLVGPVRTSGHDTAFASYVQRWVEHGKTLHYPAALTLRRVQGSWCITP